MLSPCLSLLHRFSLIFLPAPFFCPSPYHFVPSLIFGSLSVNRGRCKHYHGLWLSIDFGQPGEVRAIVLELKHQFSCIKTLLGKSQRRIARLYALTENIARRSLSSTFWVFDMKYWRFQQPLPSQWPRSLALAVKDIELKRKNLPRAKLHAASRKARRIP
ncbi:hypothetical protein B0H19DRAFT_1077067 [Mycena capillaripes]|nr:hypothetical protein B0H19DRAFT_1077067 [Mycena capillaripes]